MATITTHYMIASTDSERSSRLAEGRIGLLMDVQEERKIRSTLSSTPIVFGPIGNFCYVKCGAPFWMAVTDQNDNVSTCYVKGLFISYINAKEISISWDDILQKDSEITIHYM